MKQCSMATAHSSSILRQVDCLVLTHVDCVWNVMAHAQKPYFVFRRAGPVHLIRWGRQFSRLLAAEVCASAVVMLDTPCSEVVWRVLGTHSIRQFPLHFPSRASPCAITFQLESTTLHGHTVSTQRPIGSTSARTFTLQGKWARKSTKLLLATMRGTRVSVAEQGAADHVNCVAEKYHYGLACRVLCRMSCTCAFRHSKHI